MRSEYSANQALAASAKAELKHKNRYTDFDDYMESLDMERQAKINAQSAKLMKEVEAESSESLEAVVHVIMRALGLIAVGACLYLVFISFAGN